MILSILITISAIPINTFAAPAAVTFADSAQELHVPEPEEADTKSETEASASLFADTSENGYKLMHLYKTVIYTDDLYRQLKAKYITDASHNKDICHNKPGTLFDAVDSGGVRYWSTYPVDWNRLNLVTSASTINSYEKFWKGRLEAVDPTTKVILGAKRMEGNSYIAMTDYRGEDVMRHMLRYML